MKVLDKNKIYVNGVYRWFIPLFLVFLSSCLGVGTNIKVEENLEIISYDKAFDIALETAKEIHLKCKNINPYNYPTIVDAGVSKSRGVITIHYKYDPAAGSVCSSPPEPIKVMAKGFVPHFGAEFYMHIKIYKNRGYGKRYKY